MSSCANRRSPFFFFSITEHQPLLFAAQASAKRSKMNLNHQHKCHYHIRMIVRQFLLLVVCLLVHRCQWFEASSEINKTLRRGKARGRSEVNSVQQHKFVKSGSHCQRSPHSINWNDRLSLLFLTSAYTSCVRSRNAT